MIVRWWRIRSKQHSHTSRCRNMIHGQTDERTDGRTTRRAFSSKICEIPFSVAPEMYESMIINHISEIRIIYTYASGTYTSYSRPPSKTASVVSTISVLESRNLKQILCSLRCQYFKFEGAEGSAIPPSCIRQCNTGPAAGFMV